VELKYFADPIRRLHALLFTLPLMERVYVCADLVPKAYAEATL